MNLSDALSDGLDRQIIAGDDGLLEGTNLPNNNVTGGNDLRAVQVTVAHVED